MVSWKVAFPVPVNGAIPKLRSVVVVHRVGLGVVEVLGPFLERITDSQFCAGFWWNCGGKHDTAPNSRTDSKNIMTGTVLVKL